ncbi:uncharacterized protein LOC131318528 isoform X1 [Rhododendron vialii]|uniref:uncharacterized protein LOC131318528 isoform X1 n=1 Tax=Rhododendron vialii TaxID=182163 RepID=UPI00265FD221|nr:uncharacterized protein LOC131318528 isoform X1 [Rhododendron vialii]
MIYSHCLFHILNFQFLVMIYLSLNVFFPVLFPVSLTLALYPVLSTLSTEKEKEEFIICFLSSLRFIVQGVAALLKRTNLSVDWRRRRLDGSWLLAQGVSCSLVMTHEHVDVGKGQGYSVH